MKKFLLFSALMGLSVPALAQVNADTLQWGVDNAFVAGAPGLSAEVPTAVNGTAKTQDDVMLDEQIFEGVSLEEVRQVEGAKQDSNWPLYVPAEKNNPTPTKVPASGGGLFPELGSAEAPQEKRGSEAIKLIIDDVSIVQPALNGHAFCTGTLTMENNLNIRVQKMDLILNYGGLDVPVSFANVSPQGGKQTQDIAWLGEFCNSMLSIPQITVKSCVASTLTRAQCQSKIEYKPIENK